MGDRGLVKLCLGPLTLDKSLDEIDSDPDFCYGLLKEGVALAIASLPGMTPKLFNGLSGTPH
jgi:hypothetical protein